MKLDLSRFRNIDWKVWKPRLGYAAFFVLAFVLAFRQTFPVQALKKGSSSRRARAAGRSTPPRWGRPGSSHARHRRGARGPRRHAVSLDEVAVSVRLLPLLVGRKSVAFDVQLWMGGSTGRPTSAPGTAGSPPRSRGWTSPAPRRFARRSGWSCSGSSPAPPT